MNHSQAFVQSYRKKRKGGMLSATSVFAASPATGPPSAASAAAAMEDNLGSDADTPNKTPGARKTTKTSATSAMTPTTTTTVGNTFFGPDFSPESVLRGDGSQGRRNFVNPFQYLWF